MRKIVTALLLILSLYSSGQVPIREKEELKVSSKNIVVIENIIDSLLKYPANSIITGYGNFKDSISFVRTSENQYVMRLSRGVNAIPYPILEQLYQIAGRCAVNTSLRYKLLAGDILSFLNNKLYESLSYIQVKRGLTRYFATSQLQNIGGKAIQRQVVLNDSLVVSLFKKCQNTYFKNCYRYIVYKTTFALYPELIDSSLVEYFRYNLNNPKRNAEELRVVVEADNRYLYFAEDTLNCHELVDSRICSHLSSLRREAENKRVSLDSIIAMYNNQFCKRAIENAQKIDIRENILKTLSYIPVWALSSEIERYGGLYKNIDWRYILARLDYKDYKKKYIYHIDSLYKLDNQLRDRTIAFYAYEGLFHKVLELNSIDGVVLMAPLLLCKDSITVQFSSTQTTLGFNYFVLIRDYIPELDAFGKSVFLEHCKKNYLGNTHEFRGKIVWYSNGSNTCIGCNELYSQIGDDSEKKYFPKNYNELLYNWMVENKGKFHLVKKNY